MVMDSKRRLQEACTRLGVSTNASNEEIKQACNARIERHRRSNYPDWLLQRSINATNFSCRTILQLREKCSECKEFAMRTFMEQETLHCPVGPWFCTSQCLQLYQSRIDAI